MKRILVTGGAGYVGSVLVPKLLQRTYNVRVLDLFMYERVPFEGLEKYQNRLEVMKGDIRNQELLGYALQNVDAVIHLACISNDPSFDLDPALGRSINLDAFEPLVKAAKKAGVKTFINASSSSVYGVSEDENVTEESKCAPLTDYSSFKLQTEKILKKYESEDFNTTSIRSATVCGYSRRQRLDVIVNILTNHAATTGEINIEGGEQQRPNVHIDDITDFYIKVLEATPKDVSGEVFNYGGPNYRVKELAGIVRSCFPEKQITMRTTPAKDGRSYHISSTKAFERLGMTPKKTIQDAVLDLKSAIIKGQLKNTLTEEKYYNIKTMKKLLTEGTLHA